MLVSQLAQRAWIEIKYAAESLGYWIRPYDMLWDRRRWRWGKRSRCARFWIES